jgi:hypothetical protein
VLLILSACSFSVGSVNFCRRIITAELQQRLHLPFTDRLEFAGFSGSEQRPVPCIQHLCFVQCLTEAKSSLLCDRLFFSCSLFHLSFVRLRSFLISISCVGLLPLQETFLSALSSFGLSNLVLGTRLYLDVIWDSGKKYFNRKFTAPIHPPSGRRFRSFNWYRSRLRIIPP